LIVAAVAVFVPATETLAEVVVVVVRVHVVTVVPVVRILIGKGVLVARTPAILAICVSGPVAFLVPVVHGLTEKIRAVLIRRVEDAGPIVAIDRSGEEVRIARVVGVAVVLEEDLLLAQALEIRSLKTKLRRSPLLLQLGGLLLQDALLLIQSLAVLRQALLLPGDELLLALL
jgi:hypothetical protein